MGDFAAMTEGTAFKTDHKGRPFGQPVFSNVTLSVAKGASLGILGDEQSGAIDIVQAFGGMLELQSGQVSVGGVILGDLKSRGKALIFSRARRAWARRELGVISLSVDQSMTFLGELQGSSELAGTRLDLPWAVVLMKTLGLTKEDLNIRIGDLGLHKQLAASVAFAFTRRPSLAIWLGTDLGISASKAATLVTLAQRAAALCDATLIFASPDPPIARMADVVAVMQAGRVQRVTASTRQPLPFVSYVSEDRALVDRLEADLGRRGVRVWRDRNQLAPGVRWKDEIRRAIRGGQHFIACFSTASLAKERSYARDEVALAIEELRLRPRDRAWFIPVRLDPCSIEDIPLGGGEYMTDLQYVDLASDWNAGISALAAVLSAS